MAPGSFSPDWIAATHCSFNVRSAAVLQPSSSGGGGGGIKGGLASSLMQMDAYDTLKRTAQRTRTSVVPGSLEANTTDTTSRQSLAGAPASMTSFTGSRLPSGKLGPTPPPPVMPPGSHGADEVFSVLPPPKNMSLSRQTVASFSVGAFRGGSLGLGSLPPPPVRCRVPPPFPVFFLLLLGAPCHRIGDGVWILSAPLSFTCVRVNLTMCALVPLRSVL